MDTDFLGEFLNFSRNLLSAREALKHLGGFLVSLTSQGASLVSGKHLEQVLSWILGKVSSSGKCWGPAQTLQGMESLDNTPRIRILGFLCRTRSWNLIPIDPSQLRLFHNPVIFLLFFPIPGRWGSFLSRSLFVCKAQELFFSFFFFSQPERISGEQYGIHSDVWSLGISFMEVCTEFSSHIALLTSKITSKYLNFTSV